MSSTDVIRQNYHQESEDGVNKQISMELYASYVYMAMAYYFDRYDVALEHISKFFKDCSDEEREHAQKLMKFQNERGGTISLSDIKAPPAKKWTPLEAMQDALQLEKTVNDSLLNLHKIASKHEDAQMCDFIENEFLTEQVQAIKKLGDHVTN
ncbi:Soma ferritin, partial [Stegodyphus mimosarum]